MKITFVALTAIVLIASCFLFGCSTPQQKKINNNSYKSDECRSGWFTAKNVNTQLRLTCLRNNEEFEIFCPQVSLKANGVCQVKWYLNGNQVGELITEYVDGFQAYEVITFDQIKIEYPYYSETLLKQNWDKFDHEIKTRIYFEAAREKGNHEKGGNRYQYPNTLVKGQTIKAKHINCQDPPIIDKYRIEVAYTVNKNWMAPKQMESTNAENYTSIVFRIMPNGSIEDIFIVDESGNKAIDKAAIDAIKRTGPVKPFPKELSVPYVEMGLRFNANGVR